MPWSLHAIQCLAILFWNPIMQDEVITWIQQAFIVDYELTLSTDFDLDLRASDTANHFLVTMIICPELFIQSKSNHAWLSYGLDTNMFHWSLWTKFKCWFRDQARGLNEGEVFLILGRSFCPSFILAYLFDTFKLLLQLKIRSSLILEGDYFSLVSL